MSETPLNEKQEAAKRKKEEAKKAKEAAKKERAAAREASKREKAAAKEAAKRERAASVDLAKKGNSFSFLSFLKKDKGSNDGVKMSKRELKDKVDELATQNDDLQSRVAQLEMTLNQVKTVVAAS